MGVLLYNKNKFDEMSKILEHFMQFVAIVPKEGRVLLPNGSFLDYDDTRFFRILVGGDQLTASRIWGTQARQSSGPFGRSYPFCKRLACKNGTHESKLINVLNDMVLTLLVHYRPFGIAYFFVASAKEKGTMYQLRNLINQNSVPANEFC